MNMESDQDVFDEELEHQHSERENENDELAFASLHKEDVIRLLKAKSTSISFIAARRQEFQVICVTADTEHEKDVRHRTGYMRCKGCAEILSVKEGGQLSRHFNTKKHQTASGQPISSAVVLDDGTNRKISDFLPHKITTADKDKVVDAVARLCLRSGRSFRFFGSSEFQQFVVDLMSIVDPRYKQPLVKRQLPSREVVSRRAEDLYKEILLNAYAKVSPQIEDGITIAVDFGILRENHLAVHISFVVVNPLDNKWKLTILPIAFKPSFEPKSKDEVYRLVREVMTPYGFSSEDIRRCFLTADGASYMERAGNDSSKFRDYIRCISHSIHLIFERGMKPYESAPLTEEEKELIATARESIDKARSLAFALKGCKEIRGKITVPNPGVQTRWLSFYTCVQETITFLEDPEILSYYFPPVLLSKMKEVEDSLPTLKAIQYVFTLLPNEVKRFQAVCPLIHCCLPALRTLRMHFFACKNRNVSGIDANEVDMEMVEVIGKSALHAALIHYKQLCPVHFAAVMLTPTHKRMTRYNDEERHIARTFIEDSLSRIPVEVVSKSPPSSYDMFADDDDDNPATSELTRYLSEATTNNDQVDEFWPARRLAYPRLYKVAKIVFSVVPSEATCERAFSRAAYIVDKSRFSMKPENSDWVVTAASLLDACPELLK